MKYRRMIASLLAVNIIVSSIWTGGTSVSASDNNTISNTTENKENVAGGAEKSEQSDESESDKSEQNTEIKSDEGKDSSQNSISETNQAESEQSDSNVLEENDDQLQVMAAAISLGQLNFYSDGIATIAKPEELILLSYCDQKEIKDITINLTATGEFNLATTIKAGTDLSSYLNTSMRAEQDYTYQGLGSESAPFAGTITGQTPAIKSNVTMFAGLSSKAEIKNILSGEWLGDGKRPMLAQHYVFEDASEHSIPFEFTNGNGALLGTVKASDGAENGTLTITSEVSYADSVTVGSATSTENAGLICNTLESGNIKLKGYTFPEQITINTDSGAAGGFIGSMQGGTFEIESVNNAEISNLSVTSATGSAGGIVGELGKTSGNATITINQAITVNAPAVSGKYAGGFAGTSANEVFSGEQKITVKTPNVSSDKNTDSAVGGLVGHYIANSQSGDTQTLPEQIVVESPKVSTNGGMTTNGGSAGGYFGILELQGVLTYQIVGTETETEISSEYLAGNGSHYGAIAGKVTSSDKKASVIVTNVDITSTNNRQTYYHGGLFGELGEKVYLQARNVQVTISDAYAQNDASGFGGLVGHLSSNSVLTIMDKVKISTKTTISGGGGLVGCADSGSIVEVSGETDLSEVNYNASQYVGQLVGKQDCALIFAHGDGNGNGWKYIRSNFSSGSSYVNDIGNYGEIIRLKAKGSFDGQNGLSSTLFKVNEGTHEIGYGQTGQTVILSGNSIVIDSVDKFALLSVAWNSHGVFSCDSSLTTNNWGDLKGKGISLNIDVNLEGTGIIGISRDSDDGEYTGEISGNSHTITLAIGETFGYQGDSKALEETEGCGKIYATGNNHKYIGLFSISNGAIGQLTISGKINVSSANGDIRVGSIAARKNPSNISLDNVTIGTIINLEARGDYYSYVGGFYGEAYGEYLQLINGVKAQAQIKIQYSNEKNDVKTYVGGVLGFTEGYFKINCKGITVGGSITTDAPNYAYVGGLIGFISPKIGSADPDKWIEIRTLVFDGITINAPKASVACGGLLGGVWARTGVYFMGDKDGDDNINGNDVVKMDVKSAEINAPKASVGGLAYKASGIWEIRTSGIDIQKLKITCGQDLGLLVCHGEKANVARGGVIEDGALYLRTTQYWENSYKLAEDENLNIKCGDTSVFDELVAYTAKSKDTIANNNENGIISLATDRRVGVAESDGICTTYQNRTTYGKAHPVNGCSRYYYDLDQYMSKISQTNGTENEIIIDTSEKLVLWSCYLYAAQNIKSYFNIGGIDKNGVLIKISGTFDLQKYSYYPIQLSTGIAIEGASFTFYNEQIEQAEVAANNKSTQKKTSGTQSVQSQHYMMHCGLFLNHSISTETSTSISLDTVTFSGSIGKVDNDASGVLFSGIVQGAEINGKQYPVKLKFKDITLDGLKITDYANDEYAPLLMNQIGSYTKTEMRGVKTENYTGGTAVASSLMGNVGSEDGHQVNMTFSNMILPDKPAGGEAGIFTHATLLESYKYADNDTSVATYNFYKSGDWPSTGGYNHQVTYGKEISGTIEYTGLQKWYYDKKDYGTTDGEVVTEDKTKDFSAWLPYVCTSYDKSKHAHEIKVNQRVYDIVNGCGTYGDPYVITDPEELEIISEYMITNLPRVDWKITINPKQSEYCVGHAQDITFRYDGEEWVQIVNQGTDEEESWTDAEDGQTRTNDFMQRYIANAYYDLQGTSSANVVTPEQLISESDEEDSIANELLQGILIDTNKAALTLTARTQSQLVLENFKGLGTAGNPFRGVLTSTKGNTTVILKGANTGNGLISYSYGSVVRNLTIQYQGEGKTLTYQKASSVMYPGNCFGGVIGCILGGDNVIDGVKVTLSGNWLTLSDDNKHLLQVGGYVGSVSGGGVLFRNMANATGLTDVMLSGGSVDKTAYTNLYVNPYVGRVLDGYAFAVTDGDKLDNTDKNYQIQNLSTSEAVTEKNLSANGKNITVADAKGLLILSAIVNSGAASSGSSNAYRNTNTKKTIEGYSFGNVEYGKVRNATYEHIGETTKPDDFATAVNDDVNSPGTGNTPYLITTYGSQDLFDMAVLGAAEGGAILNFPDNGEFDMSAYGSSYQGISARYVSNAVASDNGTNAAGVVPLIQGVNGNGTSITLATSVKEYADDDFHAASVGGLFNLFSPASNGVTISNITFKGRDSDSGVIMQYYDAQGAEVISASKWSYKSNVGVGSFAGSSSGAAALTSWYNARVGFENVTFAYMTIKSPASAGGLVGNFGRLSPTNRTTNAAVDDIAILLQPYAMKTINGQQNTYISSTFTNCSYNNITVQSQEAAGGFCGYIDGMVDLQTNLNITDESIVVGNESDISATLSSSCAGGLYGYVRRGVAVNNVAGTKTAKLQNVNVTAGQYAGGIIGQAYADNSQQTYQINDVQILGTIVDNKVLIKGTSGNTLFVGGIVGKIEFKNTTFNISNCKVQNVKINDEGKVSGQQFRAGGIVGQAITLEGTTKLNIDTSSVVSTDIYGSLSGGIAGAIHVQATLTACTISGSNEQDSKNIIRGQKCAAGLIGTTAYTGKIAIHDSKVSNMSIQSIDDWGSGGLIGDVDWNTIPYLYFFDSEVEGCSITGRRAGGFAGDIRGYLNGSNMLLRSTDIEAKDTNNAGLLIGLTGNQSLRPMSIAGISIQNTSAKENGKAITKLYGTTNQEQLNAVKQQSYFSFADYEGTASTNDSSEALAGTKKVSPYVVTSPVSPISLWASTNATASAQYLYGDGASWKQENSGYTVNAQKIYEDAKKGTSDENHYVYGEIGGNDFTFDFTTNLSTYNDNQTENLATDNFPVLVLTDNVSGILTSYLDILTNGGYTRANNIQDSNTVHVDASVSTYTYSNGKFVLAGGTSDVKPALEVKHDSNNRISGFATTTEYDNTRSRFTLLTVTFTEADENSAKHEYKVQIPIIVRRMLEIDFTATLSSGTNFRATNFDQIADDAHLLESVNNAFTAYLTYTYNSEKNDYSEYGWNSYVNAGGNVANALDRNIVFQGSSLPEGTQLSLIDCQDGSKVYYYTVGNATSGKDTVIALTDFVDSSGIKYQPESIGELMGVTVREDDNGTFIKVDENGKPEDEKESEGKTYNTPTVRVKKGDAYEYYRLKQTGETGKSYSVTVDDDALKDENNKSRVAENYYLVTTVVNLADGKNLNGSIQTEVTGDIPHHVNYLTRKGKVEDTHSSTASTYQISQGYQQTLAESDSIKSEMKKLSTEDLIMTVDVVDKITIPSGQAFQEQDELYQKFSGSLIKAITKGTSTTTTSELFPDGTTGTAEFYVYVMNGTEKQYYTYTNGAWVSAGTVETKAMDYGWTAGNGLMDLPLSTDGTLDNSVSLKTIRKNVLNASGSEFYVEVKMKTKLPVNGLSVIPESQVESSGLPTDYIKLTYTSQLATSKRSLSYSTARAFCNETKTRYYRDEPVGAKLTYEADEVSQLGINLLDLQYLDANEENVIIDTTATYDMSAIKDLADVLSQSQGIRFSIQLQNKKIEDATETYNDEVLSLESYIKAEVKSENSGTVELADEEKAYSWTVPKSSYWDEEKKELKNGGILNGDVLTQAIQLKVDVKNVEKINHLYSNYKVVLVAEIIDSSGQVMDNTNASDNIIYTLAKIQPEFVDQSNSN